MELLFGNRVRSGNRRIGYLAGVEVDAASRRVTKIIFSDDGKLGSNAQTRSIEAVTVEGGSLVLGGQSAGSSVADKPLLLSRSVRIAPRGQPAGHVTGVAVTDQGSLDLVISRQHWWSGRHRLRAADLDFSQPGEIK